MKYSGGDTNFSSPRDPDPGSLKRPELAPYEKNRKMLGKIHRIFDRLNYIITIFFWIF